MSEKNALLAVWGPSVSCSLLSTSLPAETIVGNGGCESERLRVGWGEALRDVDAFRRSNRAGLYFDVEAGSGEGDRLRDCVAPGDSAR